MAQEVVDGLEVFRSTVEVMLLDGILTREEKRLVIKLAHQLGLTEEQPALVYQAIIDGTDVETGETIHRKQQLEVYEGIYEVAIVNESLSQDEWRVIKHLKDIFDISEKEHDKIVNNLNATIREKFDDKVVDKMLNTLKDSVSMVGGLFDSVRTKNVNN